MPERHHRLSQGSYALNQKRMHAFAARGRPRMTEELNGLGVRVARRGVGRLMRQNAISMVRTHKFKATTDSDHTFSIARISCSKISLRANPT